MKFLYLIAAAAALKLNLESTIDMEAEAEAMEEDGMPTGAQFVKKCGKNGEVTKKQFKKCAKEAGAPKEIVQALLKTAYKGTNAIDAKQWDAAVKTLQSG